MDQRNRVEEVKIVDKLDKICALSFCLAIIWFIVAVVFKWLSAVATKQGQVNFYFGIATGFATGFLVFLILPFIFLISGLIVKGR